LYRKGSCQANAVDQSKKDKRYNGIIDEKFIRGFFNVGSSHMDNIIDQFKDLFLIKKTEII
jgi:hypothetical protein